MTGLLLFATVPRAAARNQTFRIKMLLLVCAAAYHATAFRAVTTRAGSSERAEAVARQ